MLEGFDTNISSVDIILSLLVAMLAGLFILLIYQRTARQVTLNRSFCVSLLLLCSISAMMVLTITSNLALSLGMVGALSIVRFRTAVKDASDTAFMFWSVASGITAGARFYLLTLLGCLFVGIVCVVAVLLFDRMNKPYLLVIRGNDTTMQEKTDGILKNSGMKFSLSSSFSSHGKMELIYEVGVTGKDQKLLAALREIPGVNAVSLVDCHKG